ncbi:helix-turn-helix transcriptional regulator [Bacillus safensis]|uniref:helix-turn-helix domain-containing protein n=1 Tax=Bacillus TaxID=1386 RepID=UPI0030F8CF7E
MQLHEKLKNIRIERGLTQQKVAEELFISRQAVSNWENGKNYPDITTIVLLSKLYDVTLDELLKGDRKAVKSMKQELKTFNASNLTGAVFLSILSFLVPFLGVIFSIYLLKKSNKNEYPSWCKVVAIVSFLFQLSLVLYVLVMIIFFSYTSVEESSIIQVIK